jgi:hypothetical protein
MKKEELKILLSGQDYDGIITKIKASRQTEIPDINDIESELYPAQRRQPMMQAMQIQAPQERRRWRG